MSRRVTAAVGAAALLAVALPAMPALASAASTANLQAADTEVLPGGTNIFDITVTNGEQSTLLSRGRTINAIRVILPGEIGITDGGAFAVPGWTVSNNSRPDRGLYRYDLKPEAGKAGLAPGETLALPLPGLVNRPLSGDREGAFQVGVSSDAGETYQTSTGSLGTIIRTLKVDSVRVVNDPLAAVPQNVEDGSATAGQRILAEVTVQNFAKNSQDVTAALRSEGGTTPADSVGTAPEAPVDGAGTAVGAAPGSRVFTIPVTLGAVTADTLRTFTGSATSLKSKAITPGFTSVRRDYAVQAAPTLALSNFRPKAGNTRDNTDFVVSVNKVGTPALTIPSTSTLTLRSRADGTRASAPISLKDAESFARGPQAQDFEFISTKLSADLLDGRYDAVFALDGTDDNGAPLLTAQRSKTLADVFNLDNLIPQVDINVTLPADLDGDRTTAARNFDGSNAISVTATGTDTGGAPVLSKPDGLVLSCTLGAGTTYAPTGTPSETVNGNTRTVTASFEVADFAGCLEFEAKTSFLDAAGNVGEDISTAITVDNVVPSLDSKTRGLTGAVGRFDGVDPNKASVMVNIDDNVLDTDAGTTGVIGGCDPRAYSVDGQLLVQGVYVLEGDRYRECTVGLTGRAAAKPANNQRYLRLTSDISRDGEIPQPTITYTPRTGLGSDRVKDAAGNYAANAIQDTVNRLKPLAPTLLTVTRNNREEDAYFDGTSYYTRDLGPNDLKVNVTGGLKGDVLQLVDANGNQLGDDVSTLDGGGEVAVPVVEDESLGAQRFGVRFKSPSPADVEGDITFFSVVFDKTLPTALSTARGDGQTASVTFAEPIVGSNAAINWNAFEIVEGEDGSPTRAFRAVSSVAGTGKVRTLTADFTSNPYGGALYEYLQSTQYEDYAGNDLAASTLVLK